jgi:hypothetical protein
MPRVARFRSTIAITATYILVSLACEIKNRNWPGTGTIQWWEWLLWLGTFLLSVFIARSGTSTVWNVLVRIRTVRKFILGQTWIEGTWLFCTTEYDNNTRKTSQVGFARFSYQLPDLVLHGQFYSLALQTNEQIQTQPISIVLDAKLNYMHQFVRHHMNVQAVGAAYGTFVCEKGIPERYSGGVIFLNTEETHKRSQIGIKLQDEEVDAFREKLGSDWQRIKLKDKEWIGKFFDLEPKALEKDRSRGD